MDQATLDLQIELDSVDYLSDSVQSITSSTDVNIGSPMTDK
jgi:hypothetical protein